MVRTDKSIELWRPYLCLFFVLILLTQFLVNIFQLVLRSYNGKAIPFPEKLVLNYISYVVLIYCEISSSSILFVRPFYCLTFPIHYFVCASFWPVLINAINIFLENLEFPKSKKSKKFALILEIAQNVKTKHLYAGVCSKTVNCILKITNFCHFTLGEISSKKSVDNIDHRSVPNSVWKE